MTDERALRAAICGRLIADAEHPVYPHDDGIGAPDRLILRFSDGSETWFSASVPSAAGEPTIRGARIDFRDPSSGTDLWPTDVTRALAGETIAAASIRVERGEGFERIAAVELTGASGYGVVVDAGDCLLTIQSFPPGPSAASAAEPEQPQQAVADAWQQALCGALIRDGYARLVDEPQGVARVELTVAGRELYRFGGLRHPSRQPRPAAAPGPAAACLAAAADGAGDGIPDLLAAIEAVAQPVAAQGAHGAALRIALVRALRLLGLDDFDAPHPRTVAGIPALQLLDAVDSAARAHNHPGRLDEWAREEGLTEWCVPEREWAERRGACEPQTVTLADVAAALEGQRIESARLTRDDARFPCFDGVRLTLADGTLVNIQNASGGGQLEFWATPDAGRYSLRHADDLDALKAALPGRIIRHSTVDDDDQPQSLTVTLREGDALEIEAPGCEPFITPSPVRTPLPSGRGTEAGR